MSKHKRFHSLSGKGKPAKIYAFRHRPNAHAAALQESMKKIAANGASAGSSGTAVEPRPKQGQPAGR